MDLKIFTENIEPQALNQIYSLAKLPAFENCKIRIMPDVHSGVGCVIGFTANLGNKVIPNIVGVDIGCGMFTVCLGKIDIDYGTLDNVIKEVIPSGFDVRELDKITKDELSVFNFEDLWCYDKLKDIDRLSRSLGTLGGGNHFIEVDVDDEGNKYLVVHTGSRNLGKQVASIYQQIAIDKFYNNDKLKADSKALIEKLKAEGRQVEIQEALKNLRSEYVPYSTIPKELCYLEGEDRQHYLEDMAFCQRFASSNRHNIITRIMANMGWDFETLINDSFQTIHNYIDMKTNIVRKGAISAQKGEKVLIPINMRDGCILGIGKGNEDWNCSAPHGAGRIISRTQARQLITIEEYMESMEGIYTTSVGFGTIDESPMVYKPMDEIVDHIKDTVEILKIIKPVYNFKAVEQ